MTEPAGELVVVLDQFAGPSPNALAREPMLWTEFLRAVDRGAFDPIGVNYRRARRTTGAELVRDRQPEATTAYRCGANGFVEVVSMRWDSSG